MTQSNMYSISAHEIWDLFTDYIDGNADCLALTLSEEPLADKACAALKKSFAFLGYGENALAFCTLLPATDSEDASFGPRLDAQALFMLIEGLDPVSLVACDEPSAAALEKTYRATYSRNAVQRALGRPCVICSDLSSMLGTDAGKQRLWSLLKALPRMG